LLWVEREILPNLPAWCEQTLVALGIRYIVDFDDAVFHRYDLSRNPLKRLLANKIDQVMRGASIVICGNEYLAARARKAGAKHIEIIPTVIDTNRYKFAERGEQKPIVIGWIGTPVTAKYLQAPFPALRRLALEYPVQLRVVGARIETPGLDIDCRPWSEDSEALDLQGFAIGIMPLFDSPWERGKCGYKLIQYMASGLPVIASPVGANEQIVTHGLTGYHASTTDSWLWALRTLCSDAQLRKDIGSEGRRTVERTYSLQSTVPRLAQLIHEAARQ
jgi:glycosyltransferase involved in cell wall biosynthesis